ncbi:MAG TPA: enolase C-terminal domain-like protein [Microthrixaceae bacterium]|nr:enolase C-terminal domain-like protein [Microthrixaceae bacterium]
MALRSEELVGGFVKITSFETADVRFPTSTTLAGSDATNPDPDYSVAYVTLHTDDGHRGHGYTFTIGRGNDLCVEAVEMLAARLVGESLSDPIADLARLPKLLTSDSQIRWIGPENGVVRMATAAVVNALWDLTSRIAGKPLWKFLVDMSPLQIASVIDWTYLSDALTQDEAVTLIESRRSGIDDREKLLVRRGHPAYTTEPGWLGYSDQTMVRLLTEAVDQGFRQVKLKVGRDLDEDRRRLKLAREVVGPDIGVAVDANQAWDVPDAIAWIEALGQFDLAWVEEPTSPDDILGHAQIASAIAPIPVATGEMCQNRVMFKQFLSAGAMGVCQIDACRVAGVNENLAIVLLAAKAGVPVIPHAGGCGLSEAVQHLAMFDFVALGEAPSFDGRLIEWAEHLHEHFVTPASIVDGAYVIPSVPGASTEMLAASIEQYRHRP